MCCCQAKEAADDMTGNHALWGKNVLKAETRLRQVQQLELPLCKPHAPLAPPRQLGIDNMDAVFAHLQEYLESLNRPPIDFSDSLGLLLPGSPPDGGFACWDESRCGLCGRFLDRRPVLYPVGHSLHFSAKDWRLQGNRSYSRSHTCRDKRHRGCLFMDNLERY